MCCCCCDLVSEGRFANEAGAVERVRGLAEAGLDLNLDDVGIVDDTVAGLSNADAGLWVLISRLL